jgi:hypothetical protein
MEELLVLPALVRCDHDGRVENEASQGWVTVEGDPVLRDDDPEGREIEWCPNRGANIRPCGQTLGVEVGYSVFVRLDERRVVLASLEGKTDGTPPGAVRYRVREPGQTFVLVEA